MSLLTPIPPARLAEYWPWIRDGLERVRAKGRTDWIPEDVYMALKTGAAGACTIGKEDGFIVLQQQQRFSGPCLFVWAIEGEQIAQYEEQIYSELETLAREMKAATIEMRSPRKGWARREFFTPGDTIYIHEVQ